MTINDRIKQVRKTLTLTQIAFGEKICMSQGRLTAVEANKGNVTERTIKLVCSEFNVSEHWLRTGEGEMFLKLSRDDEIAAYVGRVLKDESAFYQQKLLHILTKLSPEQLTILEKYADFLLENGKKEQKD